MCLAACDQGQNPGATSDHTHSFGEWSVSKNATCAEDGIKVRYCNCGEKQSETVPALSHTEVIDEAIAPTCAVAGKTEGKHCSTCNQVIVAQSDISKLDHTYTGDLDATCEICGFTRNVDCSHTNVTILPAKAATCTETGLTEGKHCTSCDMVIVKQNVIPTIPHTYGEWITTKTANCGQDGELTRHCSCGAKQTEIIYGAGMHGEVIDPAVNPTCSTTGLTEGKHCPYCNTVFVKQEVVPTVEHVYNTTYSFDNSFHWYACSACGLAKDKAEHQVTDDGMCSVCDQPIGATEGIIYDKSGDGTYAIALAYNGTAKKIRIADTYQGLPVKAIYDNAFYNNDTITSVIIPDSVTTIGVAAFYDCGSLTSLVIGDSVTTIGNWAFSCCYSLTSLVIGNSVTTIGDYAFQECDITSLVIPDSVTTIGDWVFSYCDSLTSVVIGDSVTTIGNYAFQECYNLTSLAIPDSVTDIGLGAFSGCYELQFNEYENCKYLGSADNPYFALIEVTTKNLSSYTIHEDTKIIAGSAFQSCTRLTSVVIPDSVTTIGDWAFSYCDSLTSIVIPDSVTNIGAYAFYDCGSLTSIVIGDSVTTIGNSAFECCYSLTDVYYRDSEEEWNAISIGSNNYELTDATIHYNYVP